jgi:hypothetical protein
LKWTRGQCFMITIFSGDVPNILAKMFVDFMYTIM